MNPKEFFDRYIRGWFPAEPKKSNHWSKNRIRFLSLFVMVASVITLGVLNFGAYQQTMIPPPIFTGEYNPGVSVGDYVTYGNFVCNRTHPEGWLCINDLAFKKVEVIAVSGKEVTFLHTEQFKNGSATWRDGRTETWDVEKARWSEDTEDWIDSSSIIAANLTEGSCIQSECGNPECDGVKTEVRTYLGVNRNVVIHCTKNWVDIGGEECEIRDNIVYDQESGIRLEIEMVTLDGDLIASMSVVETNIFSTPSASLSSFQENTAADIPTVALYATTGSVIIAIFVGTGIIFRKRRSRGGENGNE